MSVDRRRCRNSYRVGIVQGRERYRSLQKFACNAVEGMSRRFDVTGVLYDDASPRELRTLYDRSEVVVNLSSRCIRYDRGDSGTPTILFGHAWMDHAAGLNLFAQQGCLRASDVLTFASRAALAKFRRVYRTDMRVGVLPYFCSAPRRVGADVRRRLREKYRLGRSKVVLYFGRLTPEKGIHRAIGAFLEAAVPNSSLVIAGMESALTTAGFPPAATTDYRRTLEACARGHERVQILCVSDEDLEGLICTASVAINLSCCYEEDFGMANIEALSAGVPVLCTDWGGLKDSVVHAKNGYRVRTQLNRSLVPSIDESGAARYLSRMLLDDKLRKRLGKEARRCFQARYSPPAFLERMQRVIEQAAADRGDRRKAALLEPKPWIREIYHDRLRRGTWEGMYVEHSRLFRYLYSCYSTTRRTRVRG